MRRRQFQWWHGVAFFAGVQVVEWGLRKAARTLREERCGRTRGDDRAMYEKQRLPVFAPPGVAFPIAWGINSVSLIAGGLHVLNLPRWRRGRKEFLCAQAGAWVLFAMFDAAYFGLRSPINAAAVTFAYTGVTVVSLNTALWRMKDSKAALSLATTLAWLAIANPVAVAQATWNRDPFWKTGALCLPPAGWEKKR